MKAWISLPEKPRCAAFGGIVDFVDLDFPQLLNTYFAQREGVKAGNHLLNNPTQEALPAANLVLNNPHLQSAQPKEGKKGSHLHMSDHEKASAFFWAASTMLLLSI